MRPRHRASTGPSRHDPGRARGWALIGLIGLIALLILGLASVFVSTTTPSFDSTREAVAVAALFLAILAATALAVLLLALFPHRCARPTWPPTPTHYRGEGRDSG